VASPIRIELPTPFPVGSVNAYLLPGERNTLVDTGPRTDVTLAGLTKALRVHGVELSDIELLLLTHHHTDHVGLAQAIHERSGCMILAHPYVVAELRDLPAAVAAQHEWNSALLLKHGAPRSVVDGLYSSDPSKTLGDSVYVDRPLEDGERLRAGDCDLSVVFRPGHSLGDTLFLDAAGWAIVGDHLLADGPSVALSDRPLGAAADSGNRSRPLLDYRRSLAATDALAISRAYPGHGAPVVDIHAAVEDRYALQERRASRLRRELDRGPCTAWELVEAIRGGPIASDLRHPVPQAFVVFCDVLAHLDLLVEDGRATEITLDAGVVVFAPAD
jgi:glyoxylase-like metal-dependent hydrolase (beta-lactamase superfamily II)